MYRVLRYFEDLQDGGYKYNAGDRYPRDGLSPSEGRIGELSGPSNKQGRPLIEIAEDVGDDPPAREPENDPADSAPVSDPVTDEAADEKKGKESLTREDIEKMPYFSLKSVASKNGISTDEKKADEIRADLIERLGLLGE